MYIHVCIYIHIGKRRAHEVDDGLGGDEVVELQLDQLHLHEGFRFSDPRPKGLRILMV